MFKMNTRKMKEGKDKIILEDLELDDEEFFMAEEIEGYNSCTGYNASRCRSDCALAVMLPTITPLS